MHHEQIAFEQSEYEFLLREARRLGTEVSELVRSYVAERMAERPTRNDLPQNTSAEDDPFERLAGMAEGSGENVGRNHDHYLYGWPKEC
jgi:hypothetical protein